jgi:hypothetical protein
MDNEVAPVHVPSHTIVMQEPTEEVEAPIPAENVREDPNLNRAVAVRRKAAKRSLPWDLAAGELDLVTPPPPQAEDIPARKKRRVDEPYSASTDEGTSNTASPNAAVSLPAFTAAADHVMQMQIPRRVPGRLVAGQQTKMQS